uniref:PUM-HD domain-containing protein n=1 Tax=Hyaloperonospora arabidopsidis (strain Emoy2) TaxID=559515 RepID=M4B443_HYAAE
MGHSDSTSSTKSGDSSPSSSFLSAPPQRATNLAGSAIATLKKPVHHDNPVEPVRVKLQDPVGLASDSLWSSVGLKSRSALLFSASQTLGERPASFALRAPRLPSSTDSRSVHSAQTTPPSESDEGEVVTVDNQKDNQVEHDTLSENAEDLSASWGIMQQSALPQNHDHCSANIWKNPHNDFEEGDYSSTVNSTASPDKLGFQRTSTRAIPAGSSRGDNSTAGCRVPPGMSLIDRIQEDFPRTPSPEFGLVDDSCLTVRRLSFGGSEQAAQSVFSISEEMGQLRLGTYHSAPHYDMGRCSSHNFASDSRLAGVNNYRRTFGRSTSEPPFGESYHGSMMHGYPSSYSTGVQGLHSCPVVTGATKSRWAANEDAYSLQSSQFGYAPSDFASAHASDGSGIPAYSAGYAGEYGSVKPADQMFRPRLLYPPVDHSLYERHDFGNFVPHPHHMLHRSKVGGPFRRSDFEYLHPIAHSYSSHSLLEEFNLSPKSEKWGLSAIKGHLFSFAKDQTGSRFIQQKLEKADDRLKADAFDEIFPNSLLLMTDVFGNYVIQKFLEYGSLEQQQLLVELMTSNMISLALQVYGCRVIQRALEVTQVEEQLALIQQLKGHVMKCVVDQNGNHVLQKCIEAASWKRATECNGMGRQRFVTGEDIQFIIHSFIGHAAALSIHSYGCRVIQRVLEHCAPEKIRPLLGEIIYKCRDLVKDQFGNYVVQHVISHGELDQRNIVMQAVLPEIARWSQHKYASNVVESCLEHATKEEISQIVDFILQCDESGASCALLPMMKHMYGNYVVQKLLERADDHDRQRIICIVRHNEDYLKRFTFGKHVLSRLEREEHANNYF